MTSTSDTRANWRTWAPSYATAPPASCQTLRNLRNRVEYGKSCVFAKEDNDPTPFDINTACMPWITPNVSPPTAAFYSPATACPTSWSAVSTATTGDQWVSGETGLTCCPPGFEGDGRGGCKAGGSGTVNVVQCGEADAEENENRVFTAGQWPTSVTAAVTPLQLRYRASDVGSASASPGSTGGVGSGGGSSGDGLSTGAKAAIGTVVPLVFIIGALAFVLLWRRRRQKKASMALAEKNMAEEKATRPSGSVTDAAYHQTSSDVKALPTAAAAHRAGSNTHDTPEWNVEMDALESERQRLVEEPASATTDASELGGMPRMQRKPIPPVEIDGRQIVPEVGDAYIPYRPGGREGR
ncbi:hypothetical protein DE146DRAFT_619652 [Phaeosphaeria sp. MPI-PUGE-AT-0046c]|nr:hypothetical protein DE146DRAFT_619652 [Phaeosphaeria sp. MPI-PUGE-AT-0046c]